MDDLRTDDQLARWSEIGTGYARSLPPKWTFARALLYSHRCDRLDHRDAPGV
jgi:hypothetical protein